jgi:nicotinamidase-related amidase
MQPSVIQPSRYAIVPSDTIVLFLDLQEGIIELTGTNSLGSLRKSVFALAKLAKLFELPVVVSGVPGDGGAPARITPEIKEGFGDVETLHRTTCDSLLNEEIRTAIESTGRKSIILSGVATELAVQLAAITGSDLGYRVFACLDACGGISERTEQAALTRMTKAGATTVSVLTLAGELAGDFRDAKAQQALGIVYEMAKS